MAERQRTTRTASIDAGHTGRQRRRELLGPLLAVTLALAAAACGAATPSSAVTASTAAGQPSVAGPVGSAASPAQASVEASASQATVSPAVSSSAAPASGGAITADPCSLLTKAEADGVAGVTTMPPSVTDQNGPGCIWATPTSGSVGQVEIYLGVGAQGTLDLDRNILKHAFTAVAGLADEAWAEDGTVFFRKGDTWVEIHVVRLDDAKTWMPKLEDLAKTVVGRLGA